MTNEELVALIQAGERDRMEDLWHRVKRFICQQANHRLLQGADGVTVDDLCQAGYLALVDAVNSFDPEKGTKFIGWLAVWLRMAFNSAMGRGSERQRRDPLHYAESLDAPAGESEDLTIEGSIADPAAVAALDTLEYGEFYTYCRGVIDAALDSLPESQGSLLRLYYLQRTGIDRATATTVYRSRAGAYEAIDRALYRLAHGPYTRALRECLDVFNEREGCDHGWL